MMKNNLLITALVFAFGLFIVSCQKSSSNPNSPQAGKSTITFTFGDSTYTWNGDLSDSPNEVASPYRYGVRIAMDTLSNGKPTFGLEGTAPGDLLKVISFDYPLVPSTLKTSLITDELIVTLDFGNTGFGTIYGMDTATLTITSVHGNRADGTFSGRLNSVNNNTMVSITNGEFHDVIIYPNILM